MNKTIKVLILGVGSAQIDCLQYCKQQGFDVHALSYKAEGLGIDIADHFSVIDIVDMEAVAAYCSENLIDIIYSVGSDIAMPTVGHVAETLGLPLLIEEKTARILNDKVALRRHLNAHSISPVSFLEAKSLDELEDWDIFPAIIKPVDSQGQRGVYEIKDKNDIEKYFEESIAHSFRKKIILEEYIKGKEVSVNVFVDKESIKYSFISDRRVVEDMPGGIVKGHDFPTSMPADLQEKTQRLVEESIASLDIKNGPVYYQLKYTDKEIKIIEITGRLDSCNMWRLIKMNYGIDLLDLSFRLLLGKIIDYVQPIKGVGMSIDFLLQKPGVQFNPEVHANILDNALFTKFYYNKGDIIRPINGHIEKVGMVIK